MLSFLLKLLVGQSNPIPDSYETGPFETYVAQWSDQINGLVNSVQSWTNNKLDQNPQYTNATAKADLQAALKTFMTNVETIVSM